MYLLNDGARLELRLNSGTAFASNQEREAALKSIRDSGLPVHVRWRRDRRPSPAETRLLTDMIQAVRSSGGQIRIHGCTA